MIEIMTITLSTGLMYTPTADEVLANATAQGSLLEAQAEASQDQVTQTAAIEGWTQLCERLNLDVEEHQLSALLIKTLREKEDLYQATDYERMSINTPDAS